MARPVPDLDRIMGSAGCMAAPSSRCVELCLAIPAIMATRVWIGIADRAETIMVAPCMTWLGTHSGSTR